MKISRLAPLALLLTALTGTALADSRIEGTYAMTTEAAGVKVRSATVELNEKYIREGDNRLPVAAWEHRDGYLTARDPRGAALLHARVENGGATLVQQVEGVGTVTFTRLD
ncbi:hypothetical protein [Pseudomonas oryzae]|uniref:Uncharacterized protein n=1 Tax=Pseudomonas oryzae TaxID=1392877 RepID=A0A1H1M4S3_9PSED|nr:hypothetical protein [Pseudomonas oryzae]SDR81680.1 hypothetical protein SAMN05216221_0404 [Pseudomonas oryzae]